jgi:hypothetical protein
MDLRTIEIITRFEQSWVETIASYDDLIDNHGWVHLEPLRKYIAKLKQEGADKYFRLGTSMHMLLISRSVNFGLRLDQKYIKIEVFNELPHEITLRDGDKIYRKYETDNLEDERLTRLLATLKSTLVD